MQAGKFLSPDKQGSIDFKCLLQWLPSPEITLTFGRPHKYSFGGTWRIQGEELLILYRVQFHFLLYSKWENIKIKKKKYLQSQRYFPHFFIHAETMAKIVIITDLWHPMINFKIKYQYVIQHLVCFIIWTVPPPFFPQKTIKNDIIMS